MADRYETDVAWPLPQAPDDPAARAAMATSRFAKRDKGSGDDVLAMVLEWLRSQPLGYPSAQADPNQRIPDTDPNQAGHLRNVNAVRPISGEGRQEGLTSEIVGTRDPYEGSLELATAGGLGSKVIRKTALGLGGLLASTGEAEAAKLGPLWHAISGVKLPKPITEYSSTHVPRATMEGKTVTPAQLQGKELYPTVSDTTRADTTLTHIGDYKLPEPVPMQGGARFPDVKQNKPDVWMADAGPMTGMANRVEEIGKQTGREVVVMPTALSPAGSDYSHHIWRPLIDMVKDTRGISREGSALLNAQLRNLDPKFPGLGAPRERLIEYFDNAPRDIRTTFVQSMDTRFGQNAGFPDIAAIRHAAIDPELLHAPLGSSGFSSFKLDPKIGVRPVDIHQTYSHGGGGQNVGSTGAIVPPEIMFPDVMESLRKMSQASGKPVQKYTGRPDYYFQGRIPAELGGEPLARSQHATQQWVDNLSDYLGRYKKVGGAAALASGMTTAEIAAAQEQKPNADELMRLIYGAYQPQGVPSR